MRVSRIADWDQPSTLASQWNVLARGVPFRSWDWMATWWRHYGGPRPRGAARREWFVLGVHDAAGTLAGLAPWYRQTGAGRSRTVRFLGSGHACGDYLSVLCRPGCETEVAVALADWLSEHRGPRAGDPHAWDRLEMTGVDAGDKTVNILVARLAERGSLVHRRPAPCCWRLPLPADWEDYLARLSKSHRKQLRRLQRRLFDTGRAVLRQVADEADLARALAILTDLNERRRGGLGEASCFAQPGFAEFHREATAHLLRAGSLRLSWLELDGRPIAAEYQLAGDGVVYAYQSGIEPEALADEPGRLATMATIRAAIDGGYRAYDLLRGDEAYKAHWRAEPRPSLDLRVLPGTRADRWRRGAWRVGDQARAWLKNGWRLARA
ncbi:MAG TPA: GNAT family N-acetyltransferase [Pirellulales bacterium]|nr:GNAT family N-acetyltransferase [Pirellulales bacterium]